MLVSKPPMGWNTWNTFGEKINEDLIKETADVLVEKGLDKFGYKYVVIDDCWALRERDKDGKITADPVKFPHGIKALAAYLHEKGLKLGMYSCAGNMTCAGYPASFNHEFTDAETFAEWGVDFLKYDFCYLPKTVSGKYLFRRMGLALLNSGRDILFSGCSWGADNTKDWIKTTSASMWRCTGDIFDNWESLKSIITLRADFDAVNSVGSYADMDMLIVGMNGKGNVGLNKGCTEEEYRTHINVWTFMGSPLMVGADLRTLDDKSLKLLTNKELIAIDQDSMSCQPFDLYSSSDFMQKARILDNGDIAVLLCNLSDTDRGTWFDLSSLSLEQSGDLDVTVTDVWTNETRGFVNQCFSTFVKAHESKVYRIKLKKK